MDARVVITRLAARVQRVLMASRLEIVYFRHTEKVFSGAATLLDQVVMSLAKLFSDDATATDAVTKTVSSAFSSQESVSDTSARLIAPSLVEPTLLYAEVGYFADVYVAPYPDFLASDNFTYTLT